MDILCATMTAIGVCGSPDGVPEFFEGLEHAASSECPECQAEMRAFINERLSGGRS